MRGFRDRFATAWLLTLCLAMAAVAQADQQVKPQTFMVEMRDGVKLATDVYLPDGEGPWPVVLARTPYNRAGLAAVAPGHVRAGYALVSQDVRGRFGSEGEAVAFRDDGWGERQDGYDTVMWILKQPWCNGKIGTIGASALALTQYLLAGTEPPGLVCQNFVVGAPSLYHYAARPGGVYLENMINGWVEKTGFSAKTLELMRDHVCYDDTWATLDLLARLKRMRRVAPSVHWGGWYDIFSAGTIDAFAAMQAKGGNQWLIMGPWAHGGSRTKVGELEFPQSAERKLPIEDTSKWLAHWLKGEDNGIEKQPRVQYYVMGACGEKGAPGNEWRSADSWPIPAKMQRWYLRAGWHLAPRPPRDEPPSRYYHDPANPVPTIGGNNLLIPAGPRDQRKAEERGDVLRFTSSVLEKPIEVTGNIVARLWVSSTADDAHFMARLCDVYPDGRSMLVVDGARRVSSCDAQGKVRPIQPGKVYEITVNLGPTSIVFNKGHRIRLDIASSNSPRFEVCPKPATQTVFHDKMRPSAVVLPVVERAAR